MSTEDPTEDPLHNLSPMGDHAETAADTETSDPNETMIAEATAAAIEAAAVGEVDVDVSAVANAAALAAAASAANLVDATGVPAVKTDKKSEQRPKRNREKATEEDIDDKTGLAKKKFGSHDDALAARRHKDRQRYAKMSKDQRQSYNAKRREQYHRQTEVSRQRRRERERNRYHSLEADNAKNRNARRAKLERERYQRLTQDELDAKNRKRRERAAMLRQKKELEKQAATAAATAGEMMGTAPVDAAAMAAEAAGVVAAVNSAVDTIANDAPMDSHGELDYV